MRALLVDLDDTLLDYSGGAEVSWRETVLAVAAPAGVDPERLVPALAETRRWFWDDPARHRQERLDMLGAWRKVAAHALARLGAPSETVAAAMAEDYAGRRRERMRLFPGVVEALAGLRARGVALALVTNGDASQQRDKIARHGLGRYFEVMVIEGEFGAGKPEEVVYRHALAGLGARPEEAWMVGDNLEWDVAAPQRLGLRVAWVDHAGGGLPPGSAVAPDRIVRSFPELIGPEWEP